MSAYALVCVDVAHSDVDRLFHYALPLVLPSAAPPELSGGVNFETGMRVRVPFGKGNKPTTGYIVELSDGLTGNADASKIKTVQKLCEDFPVLTDETLRLALWMKDKYCSLLISCLRCVQPPGLSDEPKRPRKRKPLPVKTYETAAPPELTPEQEGVAERIISRMRTGSPTPVLLHGVTGSGKTEVYLRAISEALANGKDAIVLVPEIALTPQTVGVFTGRFGQAVAVTHSRLSAGERFRIWKQALDGEVRIMIGPRSAVFAPLKNLGIIVIDEEHEHTYQSEISPKYHARDVALKRAELTGALVLMGSATPSLESYHNARLHVYALEKLTERVNKVFPKIIVADMRRELAEGNASLFGRGLKNAMAETLEAGQQAILFLNRRGHSGFVSCRWCGHVMSCPNCRVNYTYHAAAGGTTSGVTSGTTSGMTSGITYSRLLCHYCGGSTNLPDKCPACGSQYIRYFGAGTQKIEEEMAAQFPSVKCLRMDFDTTKGKHGHSQILESFRKNEAQVLIGTQMIAKGLDFPNVTLVGIVAADMSLFTGDFRAGEHTFQLLTQVSGRSGRAERPGRVFLQTYNPGHYCVELSARGNYEAFFQKEITLREAMGYPPFSHVFSVMLTGPDEKEIIKALNKLSAIMQYCKTKTRTDEFDVIGASPAFVSKIRNLFRWKLLVKCVNEEHLKNFVLYCVKKLRENDPLKNIAVNLTLDPVVLD